MPDFVAWLPPMPYMFVLNVLELDRKIPLKYRLFLCRRGGRVAEGGGLLNRYTVKSCIGGSNPPLSAS